VKRAVLLLLIALPAMAAETWSDAYNRGIDLVRAGKYQAGAQALQHAIEEAPQENATARVRDQIFTYTPHFWLGIARLNLGDPDGALREWKVSEDQGVVQNTVYYAQLRDLIGRANSQKQRRAEGAAVPSKQEANAAIGRAISAQVDAVTAGGDHSDTYHAAQRKLSEAKETNAKAGIDVRTYKRAAEIADEARAMFVQATDDAKKQRAARPVKPPPIAPQKVPPGDIVVPFDDVPQPKAHPPVPATQTVPPPQPPPIAEVKKPEPQPEMASEDFVNAQLAIQAYRRRLIAMKLSVAGAQRIERELKRGSDAKTIRRVADEVAAKERELDARKPPEVAVTPALDLTRAQLESAYRAFAAGDLASSDRALTDVIAAKESAEAYLLRGCERYTQAMLSRNGDPLLASATADMQSALRLNRALQLDPTAWSPKLVAFFEKVKGRSDRPK
jgi:tetratricopeptide (TPR) repeat protein